MQTFILRMCMGHLVMLSLRGLSVSLTGIRAVQAVEVMTNTPAAGSMGIALVTISTIEGHPTSRDRPWTLPRDNSDKPQAPVHACAALTAAWL